MYLPVRFSAPYCAALRLRKLELAHTVKEEDSLSVPFFCTEPGTPFTYARLTKLLQCLDISMPEIDDKLVFTYHSFRVLLATQLGAAKSSGLLLFFTSRG